MDKWPVRAELEKLVYRHGNQAVADQLFLIFSAPEEPPEGWGGAIAHALSFAAPVFPVTGADLKQAGVASGPDMGEALRRTVRQGSAVPRLSPSRCARYILQEVLSTSRLRTDDLGVGTSQRSAISVRRSAGEPHLLLNLDH